MKKFDMLPVIAAFVITLLVLPSLVLPVNAALPAVNNNLASVVTIPEDDLKRETGVMVLGLEPAQTYLKVGGPGGWYADSTCTTTEGTPTVVGPELNDEPILFGERTTRGEVIVVYQRVSNVLCVPHAFAPIWEVTGKGFAFGSDLLSQHKMLATLNGVPTKPDFLLCEIVEKEKAKIPPQGDKFPSKRQFPDEQIKTTLQDVTSNFVCKFRTIKPGVYVLDVYFVGPQVSNFIADHMLIVTVGYKVGTKTIWASDLQDICILGWSMGENTLAIALFDPYRLSTGDYFDVYYSWNDALHEFVSCDEAAAWQLAWIFGGWPYSTN